VSQFDGTSIATLSGVTSRNSSAEAVVNLNSGSMAGLMARYGGCGDRRMYLAGLQKFGGAFVGRIWLHDGCRWRVLVSVPLSVGSGRIRFDCVGSSLTLSLNGTPIAKAHDTTLTGRGAVGLRLMGDGARTDDYGYEQR
jgi:hypothetical protein